MSVRTAQLGFVNMGDQGVGESKNWPLAGSARKPKYVVFHPKDIPELYPDKIFDRKALLLS